MPLLCAFVLHVSAAAALSGSPEAKKRLLRALNIVPVLSKGRLLRKAAHDRRLSPDSSRLASSASLSACNFSENFSTLSHKEKTVLAQKIGPNSSIDLLRIFCFWVLKTKPKSYIAGFQKY
ncbi:unnamed protein product [Coccothraustes coccothraustes]